MPLNPLVMAMLGGGDTAEDPALARLAAQMAAPIPTVQTWNRSYNLHPGFHTVLDPVFFTPQSVPNGPMPASDLPAMATAGNQADAARNAAALGQREMLGQFGVGMASARAHQAQAGAMQSQADIERTKVDYERSDEAYQKRVLLEALKNGDPEAMKQGARVGGFMTPRQTLVGQGVATDEKQIPASGDEAILKYVAGGGGRLPEGDPGREAWIKNFGGNWFDARRQGATTGHGFLNPSQSLDAAEAAQEVFGNPHESAPTPVVGPPLPASIGVRRRRARRPAVEPHSLVPSGGTFGSY